MSDDYLLKPAGMKSKTFQNQHVQQLRVVGVGVLFGGGDGSGASAMVIFSGENRLPGLVMTNSSPWLSHGP